MASEERGEESGARRAEKGREERGDMRENNGGRERREESGERRERERGQTSHLPPATYLTAYTHPTCNANQAQSARAPNIFKNYALSPRTPS